MTPAAVDAIIAAVGKKPHDRAKLAVFLNRLQDIVRVNREAKSPSLKRIRKAIEEAAKMIDFNPAARRLEPGIAAILDDARHLEAASKKMGRGLSFTDYLCGQLLRELFVFQFGKATTARNGTYVKFAVAALGALGQKGGPETIVRSITACKKARSDHGEQMGKN